MLHTIHTCFIVIYCFLKIYIYGLYALIRQILQTHKKEEQHLHTGFVAIVTGGTEGIGYEVSRSLVSKNVHVVIGSRCSREGKVALSKIREEFPNAKVDWIHLDLMSLKSVKDFADSFLAMGLSLNILINNAGVMFVPYKETEDRLEEHFQVNYLSHFYLTSLLLDILKNSAGENFCSRIVNVTSIVHNIGSPDVDVICRRYNNDWDYSAHAAYYNSKFAITLWSIMLSKRLSNHQSKVTVNAVHPGVVNSSLYRHVHWSLKWLMDFLAVTFYKTPEMGADTILYLALSPSVEGQTGSYYDNCSKCAPHGLAHDEFLQEELWIRSCEMIENLTEDVS